MYTLINGSQRSNNSNSKKFLNYISNKLDNCIILDLKNTVFKDIIESINKSKNIVLAFPLYVDSPNSLTLEFLDYIYDNNILLNKNIYIIINCGFNQGEHNLTALNIVKNWCNKVHIKLNGALLIGAGEVVGNKKYRLLCKGIYKELNKLSNHIKINKQYDEVITKPILLNNRIYCTIANILWYKQSRRNGLTKKDIRSI